uniref:Uncharacterized protein n=1 Tax=Arion vulgaris TaxID=1028688 RepID=A0A0B7BH69_9EUPU
MYIAGASRHLAESDFNYIKPKPMKLKQGTRSRAGRPEGSKTRPKSGPKGKDKVTVDETDEEEDIDVEDNNGDVLF